ncbi:MAG TPA: HAD hydrolase-like protein [Beijerinckiaceae bacterium]|nr:HAD hydrolase-like protein [Beijerinckiaceae bacterium]
MATALLDLDGTLVDPALGILNAYCRALAAMGHPVPDRASLTWVIGPALRVSFPKLLGPDADIEAAIGHYRAYYGEIGLYEATPYPGIHAALTALRSAGHRLVLCTAKPEIYARRVVERFDLLPLLDAVFGPDLAGALDDKADLIRHIFATEGRDPAGVVMIGDRMFDIRAAKANGIPAIGVLWGYGTREELAGARRLIAEPADLPEAFAAIVGGGPVR